MDVKKKAKHTVIMLKNFLTCFKFILYVSWAIIGSILIIQELTQLWKDFRLNYMKKRNYMHNLYSLLNYNKNKSLSFQQAKDNVLSRLYEKINDRFVELYRKLHENDENNFTASITSDGAGINFEVESFLWNKLITHVNH